MVVGHPFFLAYNQQKYVAMKRINRDLRLRLVVPKRGCDRFDVTDYQVHPELALDEVVPLKAYMTKSHMTYMHAPTALSAALREFQPDVIYMEEEPHAFITVAMIGLRNLYAPQAAVAAFSWDNILRPRRFPAGAAKEGLRAYSLRQISLMVCGNREAAGLLRAEGKLNGSIEILPQYGLDVDEHQPGTEPHLRDQLGLQGVPVIGYLGRMVPEKGLRLLFEALAGIEKYPWKLLLVGSGPLDQEIREQWMTRLSGRIVCVNAVPYEQVTRYFRCADIFVLASQSRPTWKEQFGLSLAQAMMLGIPCIGSSSGAIRDVVGPGGLIFDENQFSDLRRHLEALLNSPELRARFGEQGRRFALEHYTRNGVAAKYLAAFDRARRPSSSLASASEEAVAS